MTSPTMTSPTMQRAIKTHGDFVATHPEQCRLFVPLIRLLAEGKPVAPKDLAIASHRPLQEIQTLLQSADVHMDLDGNIIGSGLSLVPTPHQFHLGEHTLYTWCALDALAFPAMLGRTARVISSCPVTGREIRLTVAPEAILDLEPAGAVVSVHLPGEDTDIANFQDDICNDGRFFLSHDVASTWPSLHPKAVLLSVEEAAELGRVLAGAFRAVAGEQEPVSHG